MYKIGERVNVTYLNDDDIRVTEPGVIINIKYEAVGYYYTIVFDNKKRGEFFKFQLSKL